MNDKDELKEIYNHLFDAKGAQNNISIAVYLLEESIEDSSTIDHQRLMTLVNIIIEHNEKAYETISNAQSKLMNYLSNRK